MSCPKEFQGLQQLVRLPLGRIISISHTSNTFYASLHVHPCMETSQKSSRSASVPTHLCFVGPQVLPSTVPHQHFVILLVEWLPCPWNRLRLALSISASQQKRECVTHYVHCAYRQEPESQMLPPPSSSHCLQAS